MEDVISKMISVDSEAQKIIENAKQEEIAMNQKLNTDRQAIYQEIWDKANKLVKEKKEELTSKISSSDTASETSQTQAKAKIDQMFAENETNWRKQIYLNCLGKKHEQQSN